MLDQQVKNGTLPPIKDRLPDDPVVIKPTDTIGQYGGTWHRAFTGPADGQNIDRIQHSSLLYWDATVSNVEPWIAKGWKVSDGGKTFTFYLRKGMKWSDGQPFTADDVMFWYNDLYHNKNLNPSLASWNEIGGKQGVWTEIDKYTFQVTFAQPYYTFLDQLASLTVAGHWTNGKNAMGVFAPKHYLKQFLPKYAGTSTVQKMAKDAGFDNWVEYVKHMNDPKTNVKCPVVTPWMPVTALNTKEMLLTRNPYYFAVDTDGNQLPYIDKIDMTLENNLESLNLDAIAGKFDIQGRHIDIAKVPVFKANEAKEHYHVEFWPGAAGTDAGLYINQSWQGDPAIAKLLQNVDFRNALSLGIDRNNLNQSFWLGLGQPHSAAPGPASPYYPGPEYEHMNSTLDATKANQMLDQLGLDKRDSSGFRLLPDGKPLSLVISTVSGSFVDWPGIAQAVVSQWARTIHVHATVQDLERSLWTTRQGNNQLMITMWSNDGSDNPWTYPQHVIDYSNTSGWGPAFGTWFQSGGKQGIKPTGDAMKILQLYQQGKGVPAAQRVAIGKQIEQIMAQENYVIGTVGISPALMGVWVIKDNVGNVPKRMVFSTPAQTPGPALPEQWYFKSP